MIEIKVMFNWGAHLGGRNISSLKTYSPGYVASRDECEQASLVANDLIKACNSEPEKCRITFVDVD